MGETKKQFTLKIMKAMKGNGKTTEIFNTKVTKGHEGGEGGEAE